MLVILPSKGNTISTILRTITPEYLSRIQNSLHHYDIIHIQLPAFLTKVKLDLKKSLTNMGYGKMFVPEKANFSRMTNAAKTLYVDKMTQEAEIIVDQYGTTATITSTTVISELSSNVSRHPKKLDFYADHPFFYAIYDAFGNICFCGVFTGE
jgi:serpin B